MLNILSASEHKLLRTLAAKPLTMQEMARAMRPISEQDIKPMLFRLNKQELIVKQPVGSGCRSCSCTVAYLWRLTYAGRQIAVSI